MAKANPYLMVSLEDAESKALAQVLANDSAREIMKFMAGHDLVTETDIAQALNIPLSTAHYNMQNLVKANLAKAAEFHYSKKGKEVMHYTLSNKLIVIAPSKVERSKLLKRVLPVIAFIGIIGGALQAGFMSMKRGVTSLATDTAPRVMKVATDEVAAPMLAEAAPAAIEVIPFYMTPIFYFFVGAVLALVAYIIIDWAWRKRNK